MQIESLFFQTKHFGTDKRAVVHKIHTGPSSLCSLRVMDSFMYEGRKLRDLDNILSGMRQFCPVEIYIPFLVYHVNNSLPAYHKSGFSGLNNKAGHSLK